MASIKKQIKNELNRYKALLVEFDESEIKKSATMKSKQLNISLKNFISFEKKEDLEDLKERNDFLSFLMKEKFNQYVYDYLEKEIMIPIPTSDYKKSFINIANKIENNIEEANTLKRLNKTGDYCKKENEALIIMLVKEAKTNNECPEILFNSLINKYSIK